MSLLNWITLLKLEPAFFGDGSQIDKTGTEPVRANRLSSSFINLRFMTEKKQALAIL